MGLRVGRASILSVATVLVLVLSAWGVAAIGIPFSGKMGSGMLDPTAHGDASAGPTVPAPALAPAADSASNWTESSQPTAPSLRAGDAMVYDAADGYTLMFGGCPSWGGNYWEHNCTALGDTWALQDGVWTNLTSSLTGPSPPPRVDAGIAYDSADGYVVMFGGFDGRAPYNDTWTFTAGQWTQVHPSTSPSARLSPGMAGYDADHEVVLFGGTNESVQFNDTWTFHAGDWSLLSTPVAPAPRFSVAMSYDPTDQSVLLFGGWSVNQTQSFGDTWSFANGAWVELSSSSNAPPENYPTMTFDPSASLMIMTGGHVGENVSSATWGYNATTGWQLIPTITAPAPRWGLSLSYDPSLQVLWLFGGYDAFGNPPISIYYNDTWEFSVSRSAMYAVTFTESGLSAGTEWWVNITGQTALSSTTTTITTALQNGTYTYSVATADKEYSATGGAFPVAGAAVSEPVAFSLVTYTVTFTESGLSTGTEWWVNITGRTALSSTTTTITTGLQNGTYTYSVATADKEYSATGGAFPVTGAAVSESVAFSLVTYTVTFTEVGLSTGTSWSVTFGGSLETSTGTTITFPVANGSYHYRVANVSGYSFVPASGTQLVSGPGASITVAFTGNAASSSFSWATFLVGALVGGLIVGAFIAVVVFFRRRPRPGPTAPTSERAGEV